ncbi:MAG TPA: haloalkane dehalogenase [Myxococcota bacterium]|nr:haloalkane dehalogenase [Myxococcota bacterium]
MTTPDATLARWRRTAPVLGIPRAWLETGRGDPIVFLHGNPTSSYLWRDVIPHVADHGRCLAPDLLGFGHSAKVSAPGPDAYHFAEQRAHLDALLDHLGVRERVVLVLHDWGSVLGFDWARRHPERVAGIAYLEAVVRNVTWADLPAGSAPLFEALRSPRGEALILEQNVYVEAAIPSQVMRKLADEEMDAYRAPFREPGEGRRPILSLCRDVPVDGTPRDVHEAETAYAAWLAASPVRKLFVNVEPGSFLVGAMRDFCRTWPNQTEVTVPGLHFAPEDSADAIGRALAAWLAQA